MITTNSGKYIIFDITDPSFMSGKKIPKDFDTTNGYWFFQPADWNEENFRRNQLRRDSGLSDGVQHGSFLRAGRTQRSAELGEWGRAAPKTKRCQRCVHERSGNFSDVREDKNMFDYKDEDAAMAAVLNMIAQNRAEYFLQETDDDGEILIRTGVYRWNNGTLHDKPEPKPEE